MEKKGKGKAEWDFRDYTVPERVHQGSKSASGRSPAGCELSGVTTCVGKTWPCSFPGESIPGWTRALLLVPGLPPAVGPHRGPRSWVGPLPVQHNPSEPENPFTSLGKADNESAAAL